VKKKNKANEKNNRLISAPFCLVKLRKLIFTSQAIFLFLLSLRIKNSE